MGKLIKFTAQAIENKIQKTGSLLLICLIPLLQTFNLLWSEYGLCITGGRIPWKFKTFALLFVCGQLEGKYNYIDI